MLAAQKLWVPPASSPAAASFVAGNLTDSSNNNAITIGTVNNNELIIVVAALYFPGQTFTMSGYTKVAEGQSNMSWQVAYRVANGSDTTSMSTSDYHVTWIFRFTGYSVSAASDIKVASYTNGSTFNPPDPPSLDTGSSKNWHFIAMVFNKGGDTFSGGPSGYTSRGSYPYDGYGFISSAAATKALSSPAQVEDPGAWNAVNANLALTIAIPS